MSSIGYIKLHRKLQDHKFWKERRVYSKAEAWLDILMEANYKEEDVLIGSQIIKCERGHSLNSADTWAKRWKWSRSRVKRFLKLLESQSMIELLPCSKTTHLSVCKYDSYQSERTASELQVNRKRTASEPQADTNNKDKEDKEVKKGKDIVFAQAVIDSFNAITGKNISLNDKRRELIIGRKKKYNLGIDDFKIVTERQYNLWKDKPVDARQKDMRPFIRPETLFNETNFLSYWEAAKEAIDNPEPEMYEILNSQTGVRRMVDKAAYERYQKARQEEIEYDIKVRGIKRAV